MGKFIYALMLVFMYELSIWLFAGATYSNTTFFSFIFNPTTTDPFYIVLYAIILGVGTVGIIASAFFQINIYGVWGIFVGVVLTFFASIVHLSSFIYSEIASVISPSFANTVTGLIIAPLSIGYLIACAEWLRSNT